MQAKQLSIKFKRVPIDGEKFFEILDVQCYNEEELPDLYFIKFPYCYISGDGFHIVTNDKDFEPDTIYNVGDILCENHFNKVVRIMQVCGEKLHNINEMIKIKNEELKQKNAELEKVWNGEDEIII